MDTDILWTEKAHFATATVYAHAHLWLGIIATVSATVAAATVITSASPIVAGIAAVLAAITSGVVTFVKPQDAEQRYRTAGRKLGALRVQVRQAHNLDLYGSQVEQQDVWRSLVRDLAEQKATIDAESPGTSNRAFRAARKKIEKGHFDHDA